MKKREQKLRGLKWSKIHGAPSAGVVSLVVASMVAPSAHANITKETRDTHAQVIYEFGTNFSGLNDVSVGKGTPLNLTPLYSNSSSVSHESDGLNIIARNLIYSPPATRIVDACRSSNEMSFEVWLENNETAEERSGFFPSANTPQPLRILTLSNELNTQNFSLGQFYENSNTYVVSVSTSGKDMQMQGSTVSLKANTETSMNSALQTSASSAIVPDPMSPISGEQRVDQKVVFTLSKEGVATLYLSDRNGQMYLAQTDAVNFTSLSGRGLLDSWRRDNMYLTIGNVYTTDAEIRKDTGSLKICSDNDAIRNVNNGCGVKSRYWKGRVRRVAVYCKALSPTEVLGSGKEGGFSVTAATVDPNVQITPNLLRASQIHQRLTGAKIPLSTPILKDMETKLNANDGVGAAGLVIEDPYFYNIILRDFAAKMSNRDEAVNIPLNDFTVSFIGAVQQNMDAREMLHGNFFFMADPTKASVPSDMVNDLLKSNLHYESLTSGRFDLSKVLVKKEQMIFDGRKAVPNPTPAGLLTTRQWMAAHAIAGTNRRPVEYALKMFTCSPMEKAADASGPDNIVGRDIDRFPGGSHTKYTQSCRACHTVMDGFRPAFGHFTFAGEYVMHSFITPKVTRVEDEDAGRGMLVSDEPGAALIHDKLNKNESVFPEGHVVKDDAWVNNANRGANAAYFGWKANSGKGIREFGQLLANAEAFPKCMAQKVFKSVCRRDPASSDETLLASASSEFKNRSYNMKYLFQRIVSSQQCLGGQ